MDDLDNINRWFPSGASTFLWVALVIGLFFVGLLAFDYLRRRRSRKYYRDRSSGGWRRSLGRPFRRLADLRDELKELRRQRAERRKWDEPMRRHRRK